jgi:hypothetical protein
MTVKLGDRAIYYPRVPYGRQSELFCFVTRIVDAEKGIVDLVTFPAAGEFQHINNVMPKGEGIHIHCWEPREDDQRVAMIEQRLTELEGAAGYKVIAPEGPTGPPPMDLGEVKRGPGRPRKDAA